MILQAETQTIEELTEEIQQKILDENVYMDEHHNSEEKMRITRPFDDYLMNEDIFKNDYLEKCYAEYKKAGIADPRGKEYIPSSESKDKLKQAENQLLDFIIKILPAEIAHEAIKARHHWKYKEQMLDLTLRLDV